MYILKTECSFDSAHFLAGYVGKCSNIHGHRWKVEIQVESERLCEDIQNRGMVVDFKKLKNDLAGLAEQLDHTLIIEKGTLKKMTMEALQGEGFEITEVDFRPTAENFAKYFYDEISRIGYNVHLAMVYETPNNCAIYGG
ncbi:MAG: 6-carboxytetrahydropterin synthase QueD [Lachnospiraceae bacterium]|nr:6-carboxytetrahydropterin synthase QueD [Lachnospiraceae bacterium]MDE6232912.1 6-carboxytetrahydropterin synthase QueD [Lachnospiraceae bacterium]MDE6252391.1 6-carboxytetrahydropterin synthase QueD [Lachnospiraceae bacterium]